jgi:hypothetical protein
MCNLASVAIMYHHMHCDSTSRSNSSIARHAAVQVSAQALKQS